MTLSQLPSVSTKVKRNYEEDKIHIAVACYLRSVLTKDALFTHPPNGGKRGKKEAAKLKAMGTRAGTPDILIWWNGPVFRSGCIYAQQSGAIEIKSKTGTLSPEQKQWRDDFLAIGGKWAMCRSIDQVRETLALWGVPTRESKDHG